MHDGMQPNRNFKIRALGEKIIFIFKMAKTSLKQQTIHAKSDCILAKNVITSKSFKFKNLSFYPLS